MVYVNVRHTLDNGLLRMVYQRLYGLLQKLKNKGEKRQWESLRKRLALQ